MVHKIADTVCQLGIKKDYYGKRYDYSHFVPATKGKDERDKDIDHADSAYPTLDTFYTDVYIDGKLVGWAFYYRRK
jgi:hypothetical protein